MLGRISMAASDRGERAEEEQTGVEMTEAAWAEGVATAAAPRRSSRSRETNAAICSSARRTLARKGGVVP